MSFVHHHTPRFFEVDRAGIVFFGRVFEYCHAAFEELVAAAVGGLDRVIAEGVGMPLVHAEADFKRPMRLGERLTVEVAVERFGGRSLAFAFTIRGGDGAIRATARHVHALVRLDGFAPITPPVWLAEGLLRLGLIDEAAPRDLAEGGPR